MKVYSQANALFFPLKQNYFKEKQGRSHDVMPWINLYELRGKSHNLIGTQALVRTFWFQSMEGINVNIHGVAGVAAVTQFVMDGSGGVLGGGSVREDSA